MPDEQDTKPEKSEEYQNFEAGLKQILSVAKEELDRRIKAEKEAKAHKKPISSDTK